jgi:uncharacterized protein (DUF362 family)
MADILPFLEKLASLAHPEGGWGYASDQPPHPEPTCLGILALNRMPEKFASTLESAQTALGKLAQPDGFYRRSGDREEAIWPNALILFVQTATGQSQSVIDKTANRLLAVKGQYPDDKQAEEIHDIDLKIDGWPWANGNFSWVEPTAWACLALRKAGLADHPRVRSGQELLLDRAFDDGGINYGNRTVLGRRTEPIPGPTSLMLLALQGTSDHPRISAALEYLAERALVGEDLQHLCWAKLALECYRERPNVAEVLDQLDRRIVEAYQSRAAQPWLGASSVLEALTALALSVDRYNPFCLPALTSRGEPVINGKCLNGHKLIFPKKKGWGERVASAFRGLAVEAIGRLRQIPPQTAVHIARAADYNDDIAGILQRQYEAFRGRVPLAGKRVVLKPNIVEYHRDKVINTHPHVIAAVIELCKREGAAEVLVAEGPGHWRNVEYLVRESGLGEVLRYYGIKFTDLNHDEVVKSPNLGRLTGLEYLYLSRTVVNAEVLISLPKLKTHHWAGATLSLKNLFGTLPGICYGWPKNELHWRGIANSIVDIGLTRPPDLEIVDGILGMEGDGPLNGTAKRLGALIMGTDPVAVDATCCRLMRLDPERIQYLALGYQKRLGLLLTQEIQQIGESIDNIAQPFETVPHFHQIKQPTGNGPSSCVAHETVCSHK